MNNVEQQEKIIRSCTGCGMCAAVCPCAAIQIKLDGDGFYRPKINSELCVSCGLCQKVCYRFDSGYKKIKSEPIVCISAVNRNEHELFNASSGAVSSELMKKCIELGYRVIGVSYDCEREIAVSQIADSYAETDKFRGSKYFQSYTVDAFREAVQDKSGQKYAVFGTPCQIYAFSKAAELSKNRDKYILIDIFCHGCPSMNLWKKYMEYQKKKTGVLKFDYVKFRSKTYLWHEFCFDFKAGENKFSSSKYNDPFYEIFFGKDAMNAACYDCIPRSSLEKADIRLGDFWGAAYDTDTKGVSAVVINTEKGKELFYSVKDRFVTKEFPLSEIIAAQSFGKDHRLYEKRRNATLDMLSGDMPLEKIIKNTRKLRGRKYRLRRSLKNALKHLPAFIYFKLRHILHAG